MNHEPEERYAEEIESIEESTDYIVLCEEHPEHDPERIRRQIELESLMRAEGLLRHQRKVEPARESERESTTPYGRKLMQEFITPLTQAVSREFETMKSGRPGCGNSGFKAILHLEPEVVAFLALRGLLNVISSANTFQYVAGEISGAIEDEARSRHFESCCREAYRFAKKRAEKSTTYHRKRKAINAMMLHTAEGAYGNDPNPMLRWESWSKEQRQNIGGKLIGVIIKTLGIVELRKTKPKRRGGYPLSLREIQTRQILLKEGGSRCHITSSKGRGERGAPEANTDRSAFHRCPARFLRRAGERYEM